MVDIIKTNTTNENAFKEIFLTPKEVFKAYKISMSYQALLRKNGLPHYKIGKLVRYRQDELNTWLEKQKIC